MALLILDFLTHFQFLPRKNQKSRKQQKKNQIINLLFNITLKDTKKLNNITDKIDSRYK